MNAWSPLLERALRVAAVAHQGQTRKASGLPYITHPVAVAMLLMQHGFDDEEVLAAALLHDVVEDTEVTAEQLKERFPSGVAGLVAELTERKCDEEGRKRPWEERKQEHLEHIREASLTVRAIVLADKLHNLSTMAYDIDAGEDLSDRFNASWNRLIWYYESIINAASQGDMELQSLAAAAQTVLQLVRQHGSDVPKC